eukprot:g69324.t1
MRQSQSRDARTAGRRMEDTHRLAAYWITIVTFQILKRFVGNFLFQVDGLDNHCHFSNPQEIRWQFFCFKWMDWITIVIFKFPRDSLAIFLFQVDGLDNHCHFSNSQEIRWQFSCFKWMDWITIVTFQIPKRFVGNFLVSKGME